MSSGNFPEDKKKKLKYIFTFFNKLSDPLTPCLLSESKFRMWRGEDGRQDSEGKERERPGGGGAFILSDKEWSWIGGYHAVNWTSSLCLAGCWKWTTGMCQLALRLSTSLVHSCYHQLPAISIFLSCSLPPSLSLSCSHTLGLVLPPLPLSPSLLLLFSRMPSRIPGILLSLRLSLLSISTSYVGSSALYFIQSLYIFILSPFCIPLWPPPHTLNNSLCEDSLNSCVFFQLVLLLLLACHSRLHTDLNIDMHSIHSKMYTSPFLCMSVMCGSRGEVKQRWLHMLFKRVWEHRECVVSYNVCSHFYSVVASFSLNIHGHCVLNLNVCKHTHTLIW